MSFHTNEYNSVSFSEKICSFMSPSRVVCSCFFGCHSLPLTLPSTGHLPLSSLSLFPLLTRMERGWNGEEKEMCLCSSLDYNLWRKKKKEIVFRTESRSVIYGHGSDHTHHLCLLIFVNVFWRTWGRWTRRRIGRSPSEKKRFLGEIIINKEKKLRRLIDERVMMVTDRFVGSLHDSEYISNLPLIPFELITIKRDEMRSIMRRLIYWSWSCQLQLSWTRFFLTEKEEMETKEELGDEMKCVANVHYSRTWWKLWIHSSLCFFLHFEHNNNSTSSSKQSRCINCIKLHSVVFSPKELQFRETWQNEERRNSFLFLADG